MSNMSTKNKRQISKEQTFTKIIEVAKNLIIKHGIINFNTIDLAREANIAHGTVFAHFGTKEALISEIIGSELKRIAANLKLFPENTTSGILPLLENYFDLMAQDEDFFVVIAREFTFLNVELQHSIISTEIIIRNILYQNIEKGLKSGIYKNIDITMALSFLMGTVNFYLGRKEYFVSNGNKILIEKKHHLINTFLEILIP